jgi:hypothetical protein
MKRKTVVVDDPLPFCHTMRRGVWHGDAHYFDGQITTGGEPGIVKLFENTCGSVDVSGLCGGT